MPGYTGSELEEESAGPVKMCYVNSDKAHLGNPVSFHVAHMAGVTAG